MNKGYGLGNNEYEIYKTLNDGKSWKYLGPSMGETLITRTGRIIIFSDSNEGIKYSDDGYTTFNNSNIIEGNWKKIGMDPNNNLYASSLDGKGIFMSSDYGSTWIFLIEGTGDNFIITEDGRIIIFSDKDKIVIFPDGSIQYNSNQPFENNILFILNKILLPKLSQIILGHADINYFNKNVKLLHNIYTDGSEIIENHKIDFIKDVGNKPLSFLELPEMKLIRESVNMMNNINNNNLLENELDNPESQIFKSFQILDKSLNVYKKYALKREINWLFNKPQNYKNLNNEETKIMKSFYNVYNGSLASIKGTIINSIFTLNNDKKLELLKKSIMNTLTNLKCSIQNKLSRQLPVNKIFNFSLYNVWFDSLNETINDFFYKSKKNIIILSEKEDIEFITIAAKKYNSFKQPLVDTISSIVKSIKVNNNLRFSETFSAVKNCLNRFEEYSDSAITSFVSGQIDYDHLCSSLDENLSVAQNEESEILSNAPDLNLGDYNYSFLKNLQHGMADKITSHNENLKYLYTFNESENSNFLAAYNEADKEKVRRYLDQIINEFKKRVIELWDISYNESLSLMMSQLNFMVNLQFFNKRLKKTVNDNPQLTIKDYNEFKKKNSFREIINNFEEAGNQLLLLITNKFNESKGEL